MRIFYSFRPFSENAKKKIRGFTILELMLAVFIVEILSAGVFLYLNQNQKKARDEIRNAEFAGEGSAVAKALNIYHGAKGRYPYSSKSIRAEGSCLEEDEEVKKEIDPYLDGNPADPLYDGSQPFSLEKFCYHYKTDQDGKNYVLKVNYEAAPPKEIKALKLRGEENPLTLISSPSAWASFRSGIGSDAPALITIKHFDGEADDSFDLFINGFLVWHYQDQTSKGVWYTHSIPLSVSNTSSEISVKLEATGKKWQSFDPYGQTVISHIWLSLDNGSIPGQMDSEDMILKEIDVGDPASEQDYDFSGWGPVEPDVHGGDYGGIASDPDDRNCRALWSPTEN